MHCTCGYDFRRAALESIRADTKKYKSYAAIEAADYSEFLRLEVQAASAASEDERLEFIAQSAEFAGTIMVCPDCARLSFLKPRTFELERYTLDNDRENR